MNSYFPLFQRGIMFFSPLSKRGVRGDLKFTNSKGGSPHISPFSKGGLRGIYLVSLFLSTSLTYAAWNPEQEKVVQDYGEKAMNFYYANDYSQAIYMWEQILKIDPSQTEPSRLIKQAREKLQEKLDPLYKKFYGSIENGGYSEAQATAGQILLLDPANPEVRDLSSRIDDIVKIIPDLPAKGKVPSLIRMAVSKYVKNFPDIKGAFDSLRYAQYLDSANTAAKDILALLEQNYPQESSETTPTLGPNVIEHKLALALAHFYQGRFDLTVNVCREILDLDPNNKTALSRLGSGYYALGEKSKAKEYWRKALSLEPGNKKLQKMLASVDKAR